MNCRKALIGLLNWIGTYTVKLYEHKCEDMVKDDITIMKAA